MANVKISTRAYCKIVLHAAKYPHEAVNGVLVSCKKKDGTKEDVIVDAIPLFHLSLGLTPMCEVALEQVETYCSTQNLRISGYYQANEHYKNTSPNFVTQRICEKIADRFGQVYLAMVDNRRLSLDMTSSVLILSSLVDGKWKNIDKNSVSLESDLNTCSAASCLVQNHSYRELVDFDNHLDNVTADWRNPKLNSLIDTIL